MYAHMYLYSIVHTTVYMGSALPRGVYIRRQPSTSPFIRDPITPVDLDLSVMQVHTSLSRVAQLQKRKPPDRHGWRIIKQNAHSRLVVAVNNKEASGGMRKGQHVCFMYP